MNIDTVRKALEALNSGIELAEEGVQYKRAAYAGHLHLLRADEQTIQDMHTQATALRTELERLEGVEPVAWQERQEHRPGVFGAWYDKPFGWSLGRPMEMGSSGIRYQFRPLYTAPIAPAIPALTDEEVDEVAEDIGADIEELARWAYALAAERAGARIEEEGDA